jgi:hypothetical protein
MSYAGLVLLGESRFFIWSFEFWFRFGRNRKGKLAHRKVRASF